MKLTRRQVLRTATAAAATAAIGLPARRARAADFVYKFAHGNPETHPNSIRLKSAVEKINAAAKGHLEIQVFPNAQLGLDAAMLSQVRSGVLDFYFTSGVSISSAAGPVAAINAMAFAFKSYADVWPAMDGDLGKLIRDTISKIGLRVFEKPWDSGYRQITTATKPINTPDDLKGFKMRVPISPLNTSLFKALGASPVSIDFNELYTALQTHIADGEENPLAFVFAGKLYEVQKYCSLTNHIWDGAWMFANPTSWGALPKDLQELVDKGINDEVPQARDDIKTANESLKAELEKKGMTFNSPNLDPFRQVLGAAGFYKDWREKIGAEAWAVLERYTGKLG
jgi:tripartite ATP-independent transporter DctP family solute receptor